VLSLTLDPLKPDLRLIELGAHTGLGEIQKMLWIIHYLAINDAFSEPGVQSQFSRLMIGIPRLVGDIQMNLIRETFDLPGRACQVVVDEE
jgi:hypothetical protein